VSTPNESGGINIAIDGPAGTGKSTTARGVAGELGFVHIDSGAMYRAVTLYLFRKDISHKDPAAVARALPDIHLEFETNAQTGGSEILLNGERPGRALRNPDVSDRVSPVAAIPEVRKFCVAQQRRIGERKGIVMDGRDIGSVVFPDAELKVYLVADLETRVKRRIEEYAQHNQRVSHSYIRQELQERDRIDQEREHSPLIKAPGARTLDTTDISPDDQVTQVVAWAHEVMAAKA
jgi:cytidylate kinase